MNKVEKEYIQDLKQLELVLKSSSNKYQTTIQIASKAKSLLYDTLESKNTGFEKKPILIAIDSFLESE